MPDQNTSAKIRIGVSTCLLGVNVRFDGGHKKDSYLLGTLDQYCEWVPVCPELDVGMGVPRESVRLVGDPEAPRMLGTRSKEDWTERMNRYSRERVKELTGQGLHGYILKSKSPSCGMERVKVYTDKGIPCGSSAGLYARELLKQLPYLPVEEEGRLNDPLLRENFIIRVFSHWRWDQFRQERYSVKRLSDFHAKHKFLLLAHSEKHLRQLGRIAADAKGRKAGEVLDEYQRLFFEGLKERADRKKHVNVLQHISGFFKKKLGEEDRKELQQAIEDYSRGLIPVIVVITLLKHHARNCGVEYINDQIYLTPHPKEMMLLNSV